jgi:hypothetical protein
MPHVELTQEELDQRYPSLVPPADELLDDLRNDLHDSVYQKGLVIADEIRSETSLQGRLRRPLLAKLTEQQQQRDLSSNSDRASTIRPLGGGVVRSATTLHATATEPTTATTTTTTVTALTGTTDGGGVGSGGCGGACRSGDKEARAKRWTGAGGEPCVPGSNLLPKVFELILTD